MILKKTRNVTLVGSGFENGIPLKMSFFIQFEKRKRGAGEEGGWPTKPGWLSHKLA